jgi:multicomponent Na+:H+ antiporter subunit D
MPHSPWPAAVVLAPLLGATLAVFSGRWATLAARLAATVTLGCAVLLMLDVRAHGVVWHAAGGWSAPLGIDLRADGVSAVLVVVAAVVGVAIVGFAERYFLAAPRDAADATAPERAARQFSTIWLFLWGALNALFVTADLFNAYVALELLSIAAIAIVALAGTPAATTAAMRYMIISLLGSLLYLLGVALLYRLEGTLAIAHLAAARPGSASATLALAAMTVGLALKTALFPLHAWLPPAHAGAPAPGSAVLSGLVVKASFYLLLRIWIEIFPDAAAGPAAAVLGGLGAGAILWGSLLALRQRALKALIAYSTVAQVGYLFLVFPLLRTSPESAIGGGMMHLVAHACAKASMFLAAGAMMRARGGDGFDTLAGIGQRMPLAFAAFGIGGLNLAGLPPSGGFLGKWLLLTAAAGGGQWIWAAVISAGSLLAAGYVFLVLRSAFLRSEFERETRAVPRRLEIVAFLLALVAIALGVRGREVLELILTTTLLAP